jgi:hypothetical protein
MFAAASFDALVITYPTPVAVEWAAPSNGSPRRESE